MNQLRRAGPDRRTLIEEQVHEAQILAGIQLNQLEIDRQTLERRKAQVEAEIERLGETEAGLAAHRHYGARWGLLVLLSLGVVAASVWWSLDWFLTLGWEKWLLATTLVALPLVGWKVVFKAALDRLSDRDRWRLFCSLGLTIVVSSVLATALLAFGRMEGTALEEERWQAAQQAEGDDLTAGAENSKFVRRADGVKEILARTAMLAVLLLGVAGECLAGVRSTLPQRVTGDSGPLRRVSRRMASPGDQGVAQGSSGAEAYCRGLGCVRRDRPRGSRARREPAGERRLIVLSDMRQVGGGFNFERSVGEPRALVTMAARQGLIPRLDGVRVWVLGAHTTGLTEARCAKLKAFWVEYFRRTGAELVTFGPNRRLAD